MKRIKTPHWLTFLPAIFSFFTVLTLLAGSVSYAQTTTVVYTYEVDVPVAYAEKGLLDLLAPADKFVRRALTENGYRFSSFEAIPVTEIASLLKQQGIPFGALRSSKEEITLVPVEKAGGKDCPLAEQLCSNTTQTANSNGRGNDELTNANRGCLSTEHQSSWYYLNVQLPGVLTFEIDPQNNTDDYDFAIWGPFTSANAAANCPPTSAPARCNYSRFLSNTGLSTAASSNSEGQNGNRYSKPLNVTAGQVYILLIDNYSNSGDPYNLTFGNGAGSATLGCLSVVLPVEVSGFSAFASGDLNIVKWTTQSEHNSLSFTVERTDDPVAENWKTVAEISAAGNSESEKVYGISDSDYRRNAVNYYRLVQKDMNGTLNVYGELLAVNNKVKSGKVVKIVNLMGQEVEPGASGLLIYQLEDGTSLKVFR